MKLCKEKVLYAKRGVTLQGHVETPDSRAKLLDKHFLLCMNTLTLANLRIKCQNKSLGLYSSFLHTSFDFYLLSVPPLEGVIASESSVSDKENTYCISDSGSLIVYASLLYHILACLKLFLFSFSLHIKINYNRCCCFVYQQKRSFFDQLFNIFPSKAR